MCAKKTNMRSSHMFLLPARGQHTYVYQCFKLTSTELFKDTEVRSPQAKLLPNVTGSLHMCSSSLLILGIFMDNGWQTFAYTLYNINLWSIQQQKHLQFSKHAGGQRSFVCEGPDSDFIPVMHLSWRREYKSSLSPLIFSVIVKRSHIWMWFRLICHL